MLAHEGQLGAPRRSAQLGVKYNFLNHKQSSTFDIRRGGGVAAQQQVTRP